VKKTLSFCLAMVAMCQVGFAQDNTPPEGFRSLFNGKDFSGWHGMPHYDPAHLASMPEAERAELLKSWDADLRQHWKIENDVIVNDGHGVYMTTNENFTDYELYVDYKLWPKGDSGIYLKANPQIQIWDFNQQDDALARDRSMGSGGLWNNSPGKAGKDPLVLADNPILEWNTFRVIQIGGRTSVWLNGKLVVDNAIMENFFYRDQPLFKSGPVQLQTHGSETHWKNIYVREIPTEEANKFLSEKAGEGFTSIFNGKDLTGWTGGNDGYEVVEGAIRGKHGSGAILFTEKEYGDFVVKLEFKLPPAGNNGLAIRYPGTGLPHLTGFTELQILDSEHESYKDLDPRQHHGSVYGAAPAARGFLRPAGEWNFQVVTIRGPHATVELNGNVILNVDTSTITEFMGNVDHPGKDARVGHFGFAGHGDPVEFRNIEILELPAAAE